MPEETQGQAELEPGEVTATPTEETPATEPQAIDYAALEQRAQGLGKGYSLSNLADKYEDARRGLNTAQRKSIEIEGRFEPYKPLIEGLQNDPGLAAKLQAAAKEHYGAGDPGYEPEAPTAVQSGLDPLQNRIASMEVKLAGSEMDQAIDKLKADGMPIDENVRNQIYQRVIDTKSKDYTAHSWAIMGPGMVDSAGKQATQEVTDKIKSNNKKYVDVPGGVASEKGFDVSEMTKSEWDASMLKDLEDMHG